MLRQNELIICQVGSEGLEHAMQVESKAFGGKVEAELVKGLIEDPTAQPAISFLAYKGDNPAGHVLFTRAYIDNHPGVTSFILAPLAVAPEYQNMGVGMKLVVEGIKALEKIKAGIVFVLGHVQYYPRFGFVPDAWSRGFMAPYPIPEKDKDAWMVKYLLPGMEQMKGQVKCARIMDKPEYWRE